MRFIAVLFISLLMFSVANAQPYAFYNSEVIDSGRYKDVKRTPYLYERWVKARITNRAGLLYEDVLLNFNGFEQKFEVLQQGKKITLDDNLYDNITVNDKEINELFVRGIHYDLATELANVIYDGSEVKLIRYFRVRIDETIQDSPGESLVTRRFAQSRTYALLFRSKLTPIHLGTVKIGKALKDKELVKSIVKEKKLNLNTEEGAIKLLFLFEQNENQQQ